MFSGVEIAKGIPNFVNIGTINIAFVRRPKRISEIFGDAVMPPIGLFSDAEEASVSCVTIPISISKSDGNGSTLKIPSPVGESILKNNPKAVKNNAMINVGRI